MTLTVPTFNAKMGFQEHENVQIRGDHSSGFSGKKEK